MKTELDVSVDSRSEFRVTVEKKASYLMFDCRNSDSWW